MTFAVIGLLTREPTDPALSLPAAALVVGVGVLLARLGRRRPWAVGMTTAIAAARSLAEAERLGREVRSIMGLLRDDADSGTAPPVPGGEQRRQARRRAPVSVSLDQSDEQLELIVDGAGAPGHVHAMGMSTIRDRAEALGGSCHAGPEPGGSRVRASPPFPALRTPASIRRSTPRPSKPDGCER